MPDKFPKSHPTQHMDHIFFHFAFGPPQPHTQSYRIKRLPRAVTATGDSADDYWMEELDGIKVMSDCGFRIYESDDWGYFFGIDGCGYDFYEAHWIPAYRKRGLQWHDPETEVETHE